MVYTTVSFRTMPLSLVLVIYLSKMHISGMEGSIEASMYTDEDESFQKYQIILIDIVFHVCCNGSTL